MGRVAGGLGAGLGSETAGSLATQPHSLAAASFRRTEMTDYTRARVSESKSPVVCSWAASRDPAGLRAVL